MVGGLVVFGYPFPWWKKFAGNWEWLKLFIQMEWWKSDWEVTEYSWCTETVLSRYLTVERSLRNGKIVGWLRQTTFCKIALFFFSLKILKFWISSKIVKSYARKISSSCLPSIPFQSQPLLFIFYTHAPKFLMQIQATVNIYSWFPAVA